MKASLIWFVLAAILVVVVSLVSLGFGAKQVRNGVCSRIVEEVGTQKDRLVLIFEDLCKSPKSSDKTAGR